MVKKKKGNSWQRNLFIICLIIVPILQFCIFYIYVNFNSILMAFQTVKGGKTVFSFTHFESLFAEINNKNNPDMYFWQALQNTGIFFVQGLITTLITGFIISYFLYTNILGAKIFRILLFLPSLISSVVITLLFEQFVSVKGPIAWIIQQFEGAPTPPVLFGDPRYALKTLVAYNVWFGIAGNMVLYMGAMNRIPKDVLEYGKLDGVGWVRELFQIILPLLWPTIITFITIQFTAIFTASGPVLLFTQGENGTYTISYWMFEKIWKAGSPDSLQLNYASAIGLFFTIIALPIVFGVRAILGKIQEAVEY